MLKTVTENISIKLSQLDRIKLETLSMEHRNLYNNQLAWLKENNLDFKKLNAEYVRFRNSNELTIPSKSAQNTNRSLITSIKSYITLKKTDPNAKFPAKFKSHKHGFCSFEYDWNGGIGGFKITEDKLIILKPRIEILLSNRLKEILLKYSVKIIKFSGRKDDIYLNIVYEVLPEKIINENWLSIDPGLTSIITGITNKAKVLQYENNTYKRLEKSVDKLKSKKDKKKKFSNRYTKIKSVLNKKQRKLTNKRKNFHHNLTKEIINFCKEENISKIIYGDIKTKSLAKSKTANKGLNKATQNRGTLSRVKTFLAYKAEQAGMKFVLQNEAYTSRTNCLTGEIMKCDLSVREFEINPGLIIDRDVNAAINIAQRNLGVWSPQLKYLQEINTFKRYIAGSGCMSKFV